MGVRARRTSLPVSAALLVCKASETEQASGDAGERAGDAGQPRLEAHVRWGLGTVSQRATPATETGRGRWGGTGEEVRERMGRAEGGDVGVFDTHR